MEKLRSFVGATHAAPTKLCSHFLRDIYKHIAPNGVRSIVLISTSKGGELFEVDFCHLKVDFWRIKLRF